MAGRSTRTASRISNGTLQPGEARLAFLEERGDALSMVLRVAAEGLSLGLPLQGALQVALEAGVEGLLDPAQRPGRQRGQPARDYPSLFLERLVGDDLIHQSDPVRLPGV